MVDKKAGGQVVPESKVMLAVKQGMKISQCGDLYAVVVGGYASFRKGQDEYLSEAATRGEDVNSPEVKEAAKEAAINAAGKFGRRAPPPLLLN
jgi:hypothetical protein